MATIIDMSDKSEKEIIKEISEKKADLYGVNLRNRMFVLSGIPSVFMGAVTAALAIVAPAAVITTAVVGGVTLLTATPAISTAFSYGRAKKSFEKLKTFKLTDDEERAFREESITEDSLETKHMIDSLITRERGPLNSIDSLTEKMNSTNNPFKMSSYARKINRNKHLINESIAHLMERLHTLTLEKNNNWPNDIKSTNGGTLSETIRNARVSNKLQEMRQIQAFLATILDRENTRDPYLACVRQYLKKYPKEIELSPAITSDIQLMQSNPEEARSLAEHFNSEITDPLVNGNINEALNAFCDANNKQMIIELGSTDLMRRKNALAEWITTRTAKAKTDEVINDLHGQVHLARGWVEELSNLFSSATTKEERINTILKSLEDADIDNKIINVNDFVKSIENAYRKTLKISGRAGTELGNIRKFSKDIANIFVENGLPIEKLEDFVKFVAENEKKTRTAAGKIYARDKRTADVEALINERNKVTMETARQIFLRLKDLGLKADEWKPFFDSLGISKRKIEETLKLLPKVKEDYNKIEEIKNLILERDRLTEEKASAIFSRAEELGIKASQYEEFFKSLGVSKSKVEALLALEPKATEAANKILNNYDKVVDIIETLSSLNKDKLVKLDKLLSSDKDWETIRPALEKGLVLICKEIIGIKTRCGLTETKLADLQKFVDGDHLDVEASHEFILREIDTLRGHLVDMSRVDASLRNRIETEIGKLEESLKVIARVSRKQGQKLENHEERITKAEEDIKNLQETLPNIEQALSAFEAKLADVVTTEGLDKFISRWEQTNFKNILSKLNVYIAKKSGNITITTANKKQTTLGEYVKALETKITALEKQMKTIGTKVDKNTEKLDSLEVLKGLVKKLKDDPNYLNNLVSGGKKASTVKPATTKTVDSMEEEKKIASIAYLIDLHNAIKEDKALPVDVDTDSITRQKDTILDALGKGEPHYGEGSVLKQSIKSAIDSWEQANIITTQEKNTLLKSLKGKITNVYDALYLFREVASRINAGHTV